MATFSDPDPAATAAGAHAYADEGSYPVIVTITDADNAATLSPANFSATVDWGGGSPASAGTITGGGGSYAVSSAHTYLGMGYFTVKVHVVDDGGSTADATTKVLTYGTTRGGSFVGRTCSRKGSGHKPVPVVAVERVRTRSPAHARPTCRR